MKEISQQIQEMAARLLKEGQAEVIIAWEKGPFAYQTKPVFIDKPEDIEKIVFDEYCAHNLSNSLLKYRDTQEKIAIVVKGCDSRGIVRLLEDNQMDRDRLYIIGLGCPGVKDALKAMRNNSGFNKTKEEEIADKCQYCIEPNAVIYDEFIGERQAAKKIENRFAKVEEIEQKTADERYSYFENILSTCIRCYACRQACIACNCRTCIFDETKPQWVGRETSISDNMMYHLIRASHMAGRCIECGECERVCPVNIPLMTINQKLIKDINSLYGPYEAGLEYIEGRKPPLSVYHEKDPDDFL